MDEKQLVAQILSGNDEAFRSFIDKYKRLVIHMVARVIRDDMDREELCQDIFVKIYDSLGNFQFNAKLSTWISIISYRMAINFAKKKKLNQVDIETIKFKIASDHNVYEEKDLHTFIVKLVDQLPVNYKSVLSLCYLDGYSYPEIVEITGMPEGTVKNYIHRAKSKLKKIVESYADREIELI